MKKLKNLLALILALIMVISFVACNSSKDKDDDRDKDDSSVVDKDDNENDDDDKDQDDDDKDQDDENKDQDDENKNQEDDKENTDKDNNKEPEKDNNKEDSSASEKETFEQKLADYVEQNKDKLNTFFKERFESSSGMTCTTSVETEGKGIVIKINVDILDNLSELKKNEIQKSFNSKQGELAETFKQEQINMSELEYIKICVCEKDGDLIAELNSNETVSTPDIDTGSTTSEQKVAEFVELYGETLKLAMESSFSQSGLTCTSTIEAEGRGFIFRININELNDVSEEQKAQMQSTYDSTKDTFAAALAQMQSGLPELEYYVMYVCDKDGDVLAVIDTRN